MAVPGTEKDFEREALNALRQGRPEEALAWATLLQAKQTRGVQSKLASVADQLSFLISELENLRKKLR
ncbi:hypothetical protein [Microbispora sp. GKU 823]|uniref:hypothetical protein n=1 Tax=Microbispora sp. GKU 823 TaxID=1652100 RepID=UPI0015C4609F|nr:hypothetical protein [Microbispora sp. GKU 823]